MKNFQTDKEIEFQPSTINSSGKTRVKPLKVTTSQLLKNNDTKSNSKSKKRKISKRNRSSKNHDNTQTPISMTKYGKNNLNEIISE